MYKFNVHSDVTSFLPRQIFKLAWVIVSSYTVMSDVSRSSCFPGRLPWNRIMLKFNDKSHDHEQCVCDKI